MWFQLQDSQWLVIISIVVGSVPMLNTCKDYINLSSFVEETLLTMCSLLFLKDSDLRKNSSEMLVEAPSQMVFLLTSNQFIKINHF